MHVPARSGENAARHSRFYFIVIAPTAEGRIRQFRDARMLFALFISESKKEILGCDCFGPPDDDEPPSRRRQPHG